MIKYQTKWFSFVCIELISSWSNKKVLVRKKQQKKLHKPNWSCCCTNGLHQVVALNVCFCSVLCGAADFRTMKTVVALLLLCLCDPGHSDCQADCLSCSKILPKKLSFNTMVRHTKIQTQPASETGNFKKSKITFKSSPHSSWRVLSKNRLLLRQINPVFHWKKINKSCSLSSTFWQLRHIYRYLALSTHYAIILLKYVSFSAGVNFVWLLADDLMNQWMHFNKTLGQYLLDVQLQLIHLWSHPSSAATVGWCWFGNKWNLMWCELRVIFNMTQISQFFTTI